MWIASPPRVLPSTKLVNFRELPAFPKPRPQLQRSKRHQSCCIPSRKSYRKPAISINTSKMSSSSNLFCCPVYLLGRISHIRTPKERKLGDFVSIMANTTSLFFRAPPTKSSSSYAGPIPLPPNLLALVLTQSPFVIQAEKWVNREKIQMRFFVPGRVTEGAF